jgi:hypothetical protein
MDERRTLALLGWTVGGVVGLMFLLNAIALASLQQSPMLAPNRTVLPHLVTAQAAAPPPSGADGTPIATAGQLQVAALPAAR